MTKKGEERSRKVLQAKEKVGRRDYTKTGKGGTEKRGKRVSWEQKLIDNDQPLKEIGKG